jgi:hypothetical protein
MDAEGIKEKIKGITDPHRPWGKLWHNPEDIPVTGLATLVRDREDFEDAGLPDGRVRAGAGEQELKKFLELPNGIPSNLSRL